MVFSKIIFICIFCLILSIIISNIKPEFKLYFTIIFGIVVISILFGEISFKVNDIQGLITSYGIEMDNFTTLIKIVLIAYICDFISLICKDLDYESIGKKVEFSGKIIILIYSFDIIKQFLDEVFVLFN